MEQARRACENIAVQVPYLLAKKLRRRGMQRFLNILNQTSPKYQNQESYHVQFTIMVGKRFD